MIDIQWIYKDIHVNAAYPDVTRTTVSFTSHSAVTLTLVGEVFTVSFRFAQLIGSPTIGGCIV